MQERSDDHELIVPQTQSATPGEMYRVSFDVPDDQLDRIIAIIGDTVVASSTSLEVVPADSAFTAKKDEESTETSLTRQPKISAGDAELAHAYSMTGAWRANAIGRIAISRDDLELAQTIDDFERRASAVAAIADQRNDLDLALTITDSGCRDQAISSIAVQRSDVDLARSVTDPYYRDGALAKLALEHGDVDLAQSIEYDPTRDRALERLAIGHGDLSAAEKIKNPNTRQRTIELVEKVTLLLHPAPVRDAEPSRKQATPGPAQKPAPHKRRRFMPWLR